MCYQIATSYNGFFFVNVELNLAKKISESNIDFTNICPRFLKIGKTLLKHTYHQCLFRTLHNLTISINDLTGTLVH